MNNSSNLATRLRDDLMVDIPDVVRALPIAEALSPAARLDLVRQAKSKVDGLIGAWPWEEPAAEAGAPPTKKAKNLKVMQRRLAMALEVAGKGVDLLEGDEEQAINLVVAWLMFHGNTEVTLPNGRVVDVSGKMTFH